MNWDEVIEQRKAEQRRRLRFRVLWISAAGLAFAVIVWFGGRPAVHEIKAWQARKHARSAFAAIEQKHWDEARSEAVAAFQLWPAEPEAIRAVARLLSITNEPSALDFWKRLADRAQLTRDDLREKAKLALSISDAADASSAIGTLMAKDPAPADLLLSAQLAMLQRSAVKARDALQQVLNDPHASEREQLEAIVMELSFDSTETTPAIQSDVQKFWPRIEKLAGGTSDTALDALVILANRALIDTAGNSSPLTIPAQELSDRLMNHPQAQVAQKLLALDLLEHIDASQREALIERATASWKNSDPSQLSALGAWLNRKNEYQRELDTIPLEKALLKRDLFLQHLDALAGVGQWAEIKNLLTAERFSLDETVRNMYLARCSAQLGETIAAENNWRRALESAGADLRKLAMLAQYAEKDGNVAIAEAAYTHLTANAPRLRSAQQGRLRAAQATGDLTKIHAVLADMLRIWPNDTAVQNDEAYTRLLLRGGMGSVPSTDKENAQRRTSNAQGPTPDNPEIVAIEQLAAKLVETEPASLPHRTLLALARLRLGRPAGALEAYANISVPKNVATPSAIAVHAAILAANGRTEDAATEIRDLGAQQLLPAEAALVQNIER
jgi:hypothetical protein